MLRSLKKRLNKLLVNSPKPLDFLIVGAQKSGTTARDRYLRNHPNIGLPNIKELHFFDN
ncbi:MAG: sulfotransferase, partial [Chitinophagaceae bacterium]|nr:sulfotransferase [Chitinophagaceae bacterium]